MQTGKSQKVALPKMEQLQKIQKVSESYQSQLEVQPLSQEPMFFRSFVENPHIPTTNPSNPSQSHFHPTSLPYLWPFLQLRRRFRCHFGRSRSCRLRGGHGLRSCRWRLRPFGDAGASLLTLRRFPIALRLATRKPPIHANQAQSDVKFDHNL